MAKIWTLRTGNQTVPALWVYSRLVGFPQDELPSQMKMRRVSCPKQETLHPISMS
jgi:hypothetical protein